MPQGADEVLARARRSAASGRVPPTSKPRSRVAFRAIAALTLLLVAVAWRTLVDEAPERELAVGHVPAVQYLPEAIDGMPAPDLVSFGSRHEHQVSMTAGAAISGPMVEASFLAVASPYEEGSLTHYGNMLAPYDGRAVEVNGRQASIGPSAGGGRATAISWRDGDFTVVVVSPNLSEQALIEIAQSASLEAGVLAVTAPCCPIVWSGDGAPLEVRTSFTVPVSLRYSPDDRVFENGRPGQILLLLHPQVIDPLALAWEPADLQVIDIDGRSGLVQTSNGVSKLITATPDGLATVVASGAFEDVDEAVALVRALRPVPLATWNAAVATADVETWGPLQMPVQGRALSELAPNDTSGAP